MSWVLLYHLGDLHLTLAMGGAIAAWMVAARAWRLALCWSIAFGLTLGLVAASKIAYLGWAVTLPSLRFKALSGHATGFAVTSPVLIRLWSLDWSPFARRAAMFAACSLSLAVAGALVQAHQHTASEAAAGWMLGTGAAFAAIQVLGREILRPTAKAKACFLVALLSALALDGLFPANSLLVRTALVLSGRTAPHPWYGADALYHQ